MMTLSLQRPGATGFARGQAFVWSMETAPQALLVSSPLCWLEPWARYQVPLLAIAAPRHGVTIAVLSLDLVSSGHFFCSMHLVLAMGLASSRKLSCLRLCLVWVWPFLPQTMAWICNYLLDLREQSLVIINQKYKIPLKLEQLTEYGQT